MFFPEFGISARADADPMPFTKQIFRELGPAISLFSISEAGQLQVQLRKDRQNLPIVCTLFEFRKASKSRFK